MPDREGANTVRIWPDHHSIDEFIVTVSTQELKNIQEGLLLVDRIKDSPWGIGANKTIRSALKANHDYRFAKYESDPEEPQG